MVTVPRSMFTAYSCSDLQTLPSVHRSYKKWLGFDWWWKESVHIDKPTKRYLGCLRRAGAICQLRYFEILFYTSSHSQSDLHHLDWVHLHMLESLSETLYEFLSSIHQILIQLRRPGSFSRA